MSVPTRAELARAVLGCEAIAAAFKDRARSYRAALQADAEAEYHDQGTAPTWRIPELGSVSLPMGQDTVAVTNPDAYGAWVARAYPSEAKTVIEVSPAFTTVLLGRLVPADDGADDGDGQDGGNGELVDPATGEVVPGVRLRRGEGPRPLRIVPAGGVKDQLAERARELLAGTELPELPASATASGEQRAS